MNRRPFFVTMLLAALLTLGSSALADDWVQTGSSVRTKSVGPFTAKVYSIRHDIKGRIPAKTKQHLLDAEIEKKFTWRMLRDVESGKIQGALRDAIKLQGFTDDARTNAFVGAFNKDEVKENSAVVITYNPDKKTTSIWVQNGGSASVAGVDFMKAVWGIWLGKIDQPSMGDQLVASAPTG